MGNRPIPRRPWRRPPRLKGRRRPIRWVEMNVNAAVEDCTYAPSVARCTSDDPIIRRQTVSELWNGDFDAEYADDSTVLLERIVGDISVRGFNAVGPEGEFSVPTLRMALLAVEEVEDIATWNPPNLWVREDLEEFQWMWLWQTLYGRVPWVFTGGAEPSIFYSDEYHLDINVKRKLGKKDHIVLLAQLAHSNVELALNESVEFTHNLRGLFSTK